MIDLPANVRKMNVTAANKWDVSHGYKLVWICEKGRTMAVRVH